jgi:hypothetical protein
MKICKRKRFREDIFAKTKDILKLFLFTFDEVLSHFDVMQSHGKILFASVPNHSSHYFFSHFFKKKPKYLKSIFQLLGPVLRIHDILGWIRICGSMPLTNDSDPDADSGYGS